MKNKNKIKILGIGAVVLFVLMAVVPAGASDCETKPLYNFLYRRQKLNDFLQEMDDFDDIDKFLDEWGHLWEQGVC